MEEWVGDMRGRDVAYSSRFDIVVELLSAGSSASLATSALDMEMLWVV